MTGLAAATALDGLAIPEARGTRGRRARRPRGRAASVARPGPVRVVAAVEPDRGERPRVRDRGADGHVEPGAPQDAGERDRGAVRRASASGARAVSGIAAALGRRRTELARARGPARAPGPRGTSGPCRASRRRSRSSSSGRAERRDGVGPVDRLGDAGRLVQLELAQRLHGARRPGGRALAHLGRADAEDRELALEVGVLDPVVQAPALRARRARRGCGSTSRRRPAAARRGRCRARAP